MADSREPNFGPSSRPRDRSGEGGGGRHSSSRGSAGKSDGPTFFRGDSSERRKMNAQFYKSAQGGLPPPGQQQYPPYPPPPGQGGMPMPPYGAMMPPPGYAPYPYPYPYLGMVPHGQMPHGQMPHGQMPPPGMFYPFPPMMTAEQMQQMEAARTNAAAASTSGFSHIKLQNLIESQGKGLILSQEGTTDQGTTLKKTAVGDDDSKVIAEGTLAKTEAGDGMFGADIELDSLTDSDERGDRDIDLDKGLLAMPKQATKFKIVTGEDSDSIFEEHLQQEGKLEEMDYSDYDEEGWNMDDYNEMNEQAPEQLPLETILEENSQMKDSPPMHKPTKAPIKNTRPASSKQGKAKRGTSPSKRAPSPSKTKQQHPPLKGKTMHQSPSARRYPEMNEYERKMAESDAYLRKIQVKSTAKQKIMVLNKKEKAAQIEKDMEMSQMSNWTDESKFNVDVRERETLKKKQQQILDNIHRTGLPDREQLVDTIVALRVEKNHSDEEIRLYKVSCARLKKQLAIALEQAANGGDGGARSEWIKHQPETATPHTGMMPTDLENSLNENRKLKRTINGLQEQNSYFKVAAEKYQKRAIYVRKKYAQLAAKARNGGISVDAASNATSADDKLRLKCSKLTEQIRKHTSIMDEKNKEIAKLKSKVGNVAQFSKFRLEAEKYAKMCDKLTQRLLLLERNEQKVKQYEELRGQLQETMLLDDIETAERQESQRLKEAEDKRLAEEQEAKALADAEAAVEEPEEVEFDDDKDKYQEDLFIKHDAPPMSNKDIFDAVGLEYTEPDYSPKKTKKKKAGASIRDSNEFAAEELDSADQAMPEDGSKEGEQSESSVAVTVQNPTKDYVAATLNAWNQCPTIVKKQLDKQNDEIVDLKARLREYEVKIQMKKNDFEKQQAATMKKDLMKHKENIENIYKRKLEDEKRKLLKQRVDEVDQLMKENKRLNAKIAAKW